MMNTPLYSWNASRVLVLLGLGALSIMTLRGGQPVACACMRGGGEVTYLCGEEGSVSVSIDISSGGPRMVFRDSVGKERLILGRLGEVPIEGLGGEVWGGELLDGMGRPVASMETVFFGDGPHSGAALTLHGQGGKELTLDAYGPEISWAMSAGEGNAGYLRFFEEEASLHFRGTGKRSVFAGD